MAASGTRPWLVLLAVVLVALAVLREAGVVSVNLCRSTSHSSFNASMANSNLLREDVRGYSIVDLPGGGLQVQIQTDAEGSAELTAELSRLELKGLYWLPLFKSGSCEYEATFACGGLDVSGEMYGTVELSVRGLCSAHEFRRMILAEVGDEIRKFVGDQLGQ